MGGWSQAPLARFYICAIVLSCVEQKVSIDGCTVDSFNGLYRRLPQYTSRRRQLSVFYSAVSENTWNAKAAVIRNK